MENKIINPVILIGGSGTRLWPMSRANYPKQFNKFLGKHSLFQNTLLRLQTLKNIGKTILVVSESNYFLCIDQLSELSIENVDIIVEPVGRNTAPAVAVVAEHILRHYGENHLMLVLPSDHHIKDTEKFIATIEQAVPSATEKLVLFGVKPTAPATGYGYIQAESSAKPAKVAYFLEKPNRENAEKLILHENCFWNSGMFFFSVKAILHEMQLHIPDIKSLAEKTIAGTSHQGNTFHLSREYFLAMPNLPLDIAVMEKTHNAFIYPLESDWSDLGDWNSIYETENADEDGNVKIGQVLSLDTKNSYLHSNDKLVTTVGVDNLVVVSTKDSVLVADKNKVQNVKALVDLLKSGEFADRAHSDLIVYRPWGSYESVINMHNFQVKHIVVKPGGKLSLQLHHHRSEHWIVVKGIAEVVCGDKTFEVSENESTYIPKETKHRLINYQKTPLHLIEVQVGDYLGEDDIVRFDDIYGRANVAEIA